MKKKEITGLNDIRYIGITLGGLNPDNVDYIYNKRLQYFYYQNSSQKEITGNDEGLKYDERGFIINATFNKIYGTGLQIPESTFIENELNRINKIDLTQLENSQKDLVRFYKQYLEAKQQASEPQQPENVTGKKYSEKYYALYHWVLIEMGKEKPFEKDSITDRYSKPDIMKFGKERYKFKTQGQDFYYTYINTDITKKTAIAISYGKDYKKKLIEISNNDSDVITHLKKYPN